MHKFDAGTRNSRGFPSAEREKKRGAHSGQILNVSVGFIAVSRDFHFRDDSSRGLSWQDNVLFSAWLFLHGRLLLCLLVGAVRAVQNEEQGYRKTKSRKKWRQRIEKRNRESLVLVRLKKAITKLVNEEQAMQKRAQRRLSTVQNREK